MSKSSHAEREEKILASWNEKGIFEKTLKKTAGGKPFVFYEGPPTANGRPGIHHLEARAFKDAIPRYQTMRGRYVRRKGGWDTHGLPVELQVEKELGFTSKKDIEAYGIAAFNEKCKESVWTYVREWEQFTHRIGYWIDLKNPYITYKPGYIESLWNIVKTVADKDLLYKDYKVVPWCPRDGTALSSHELAQGYEVVKDLSVFVRFKIKNSKFKDETQSAGAQNTYLLAWTTTPWTLPGNVALAVGEKIEYVKVRVGGEILILAKERLSSAAFKDVTYEIVETVHGRDLIGLEYEPLYPFIRDSAQGAEKGKMRNAFKVYAADFVTTADGTGIVHIAPMYGQDDFELGTRQNLPKYHLVNVDGTFTGETGFLAGKFVKAEEVAVDIIKDLAHRGLLFHKEKHEHSYPFCWRCHTPLIYFARDSWYIRMSTLRHSLVKENEGIHWEPGHIKEGRFGEWLREVKDWAISRERYWGTPLPVWSCSTCARRRVVGSIAELAGQPKNTYYVMRHGEADNNVAGILSGVADVPHHLTDVGKKEVLLAAERLKKQRFDLIYVSPFVRTRETADIVRKTLGLKEDQVIFDARLRELASGVMNGKTVETFYREFPFEKRFENMPQGGETYADIKKRMGDFLYDMEKRHQGKKILVISHETPIWLLTAAAAGMDRTQALALRDGVDFIVNAEFDPLNFSILPHNAEYELDLHRPYIDEVTFDCMCGGEMTRVKEVMDVWFDSGAMPFAQEQYPFKKRGAGSGELGDKRGGIAGFFAGRPDVPYPADFISEAIDQTRGWFYTLHAVGTLMGRGKAYKNVICLGHILDAQGKKMSKSIGNVVNPWDMMDTYGADALRFWMYSVNQPGDSKNFEEKTVDEVVKKVFNLAGNVLSFYKMYAEKETNNGAEKQEGTKSKKQKDKEATTRARHVLDRWIMARLNELTQTVTHGLDAYVFLEPARAIRDFIGDLSQWYLRRSRDRFKGDDALDRESALMTTRTVLLTLAKIMAPFTPFFAEYLYLETGGELESVHLEDWPSAGTIDFQLLKDMELVRTLSSHGLEERSIAKINVRQPLQRFTIQNEIYAHLSHELLHVIKDEINVKEIIFDSHSDTGFTLDTTLTPELKEEGELRELLRRIQDLRKEKGFTVKDLAVLIATEDLRPIISKNEQMVKSATNLSGIEFGAAFDLKR